MMQIVDYTLWRALQEIKDLQVGELLYIERPVCASGERVIVTLYRPIEDNSSCKEL